MWFLVRDAKRSRCCLEKFHLMPRFANVKNSGPRYWVGTPLIGLKYWVGTTTFLILTALNILVVTCPSAPFFLRAWNLPLCMYLICKQWACRKDFAYSVQLIFSDRETKSLPKLTSWSLKSIMQELDPDLRPSDPFKRKNLLRVFNPPYPSLGQKKSSSNYMYLFHFFRLNHHIETGIGSNLKSRLSSDLQVNIESHEQEMIGKFNF